MHPSRFFLSETVTCKYGDSLHNHVIRIAKAADKENAELYKYNSATISGSYLWHHKLDNHLKPSALGLEKPFDVVIPQGHSIAHRTPEKHESFVNKATEFNELIKATGAKTALSMTWVYMIF